MNDQTIVELIHTGQNDRALNALYKHFPMIRSLIRSNGGTRKDAEDVFQEALIILVKKIRGGGFVLTAQLSSYLYSVCRFLWKDELKKRNKLVPHDPAWETASEPSASGLTGSELAGGLTAVVEEELYAAVEEEDRARLAERVLGELKERCRELLLLFYEGRWKLKDIADRMGYSSENTAKNQKYKCLESARNRLKELKQNLQTF